MIRERGAGDGEHGFDVHHEVGMPGEHAVMGFDGVALGQLDIKQQELADAIALGLRPAGAADRIGRKGQGAETARPPRPFAVYSS